MLSISDVQAQGFFRERREYIRDHKPKPACAVKIIGIVSTCIGGCVAVYGFFSYVATEGEGPNNNTLAVTEIGAAMAVTGIGLIIAGSIHDRNRHRWSLVAPKKNEMGLAYNF